MKTELGTLVAKKEGIYTIYVFQLEDNEYIMCTKLPNWDVPFINIGDKGFFTYTVAIAGEEYYNLKTDEMIKYNYTNVYFINFVEYIEIEQKEIKII